MNKRNIERKRIEQISPTISTRDQIQGNELFMVSARDTNSANGYSTKKMGIQALKDYVLAELTGNNEIVMSNGGYEMYDTSEPSDGTYSSISEYENSSNNYAWYLKVPQGGTLTKTVTKDCVVWIDGVGGQDDYNYNWSVYIDSIKIYSFLFRNNDGARAIYVKRGQELKLETQTYPIKLSVIPLASGGRFFIDTSIAPEQGTLTQNFTYEATRPTLFVHNHLPNVSQTTSAKINGKNVVPMEHSGVSVSSYYILKTGDTLTTVVSSNVTANYVAYALLEDSNAIESEPESVQLWENGPYWATKNIGAKRDIDFGEYFQYGSLNGYRYENKVYVGNGSDNYEFPTNDSLVYGKSKEQLL